MLDKAHQGERWYENPESWRISHPSKYFGDWVFKRDKLVKEQIGNNKEVLADWENAIWDKKNGLLLVFGYLPTPEGSVFKHKISGTTLTWCIKVDEADREQAILKGKDRMNSSKVDLFLHGHTGNAIELLPMMKERVNDEPNNIQLSLGLMGADGTALSGRVGKGETGLAQVKQAIAQITNKDASFKEKIALVWGHSMQGYTVLEMAALMHEELPRAVFEAITPVIKGSQNDKGSDMENKAVWLHAGWRGMLVQLLPALLLIPNESIRREIMDWFNKGGVFSQVIGYYVRDQANAALRYNEILHNLRGLMRQNTMLKKLPDLFQDKDIMEGLNEAVKQKRAVIEVGIRDRIVNSKFTRKFGEDTGVPVRSVKIGHIPLPSKLVPEGAN